MKKFIDPRQLPIAYLTPEGDLLLDDEMADYYTTHEFEREELITLPSWDAERNIFLITGERGGRLPDRQNDPNGSREQLREAIRKAVGVVPVSKPSALDDGPAEREESPAERFTRITREQGIAAATEDMIFLARRNLVDDETSGGLDDSYFDGEDLEDWQLENLDEEGCWKGPLMMANKVDDNIDLCLPGQKLLGNQMAIGLDWWGNNPAFQALCYDNDSEEGEPAVAVRYDNEGRVVEVFLRDPMHVRVVSDMMYRNLHTIPVRPHSPWQDARDAEPKNPDIAIQ